MLVSQRFDLLVIGENRLTYRAHDPHQRQTFNGQSWTVVPRRRVWWKPPPKSAWRTIGSIPAACCSGQLRAQDAFSPPSAVRRNPDSVSCPVLRSKFMFISFKTWRAKGASSCTAFSKWASLSSRLAEPPCVPSRRSSKWRIRLVMYAGTVLCDIAHLLLTIICVMRRQRAGCEVLLLPEASPRPVNHSGSHAPPNRNRLGGRWLLDPTCDFQCRGQ